MSLGVSEFDCARLVLSQATFDAKPCVGVFDSGVGGLSVLGHLMQALPSTPFVYLADTKRVPYGPKSDAEILQLTQAAVRWLKAQGAKLVVVACNTASASSLQQIRAEHPGLHVVGLVPALKPAVLATQTKKVAVLATKATLNGHLFKQVVSEFAQPNQTCVYAKCIEGLVPWVEAGMPSSSPTLEELKATLDDWSEKQVDQLVLGCTHYPFFKGVVHSMYPSLQVHDSGEAVARRVLSLAQALPELTSNFGLKAYSTKEAGQDQAVFERLLGLSSCHAPIKTD